MNGRNDLETPPPLESQQPTSPGSEGPSEPLSEIPLERGETGASLPAAEELRVDVGSRRRLRGVEGGRPNRSTLHCYSALLVILLVCIVAFAARCNFARSFAAWV